SGDLPAQAFCSSSIRACTAAGDCGSQASAGRERARISATACTRFGIGPGLYSTQRRTFRQTNFVQPRAPVAPRTVPSTPTVMLLTPGKATVPQEFPCVETIPTAVPVFGISAYAFAPRTTAKSAASASQAGGGCTPGCDGSTSPVQRPSTCTAMPPPCSGRARAALPVAIVNGWVATCFAMSTQIPLSVPALPVMASTVPVESSAAATGRKAPETVAEATSNAWASCLRTVRAVDVAKREITPPAYAGPSTTGPLPIGAGFVGSPPWVKRATLTGPVPQSPMKPARCGTTSVVPKFPERAP